MSDTMRRLSQRTRPRQPTQFRNRLCYTPHGIFDDQALAGITGFACGEETATADGLRRPAPLIGEHTPDVIDVLRGASGGNGR
jgi:hypothetical protein